MRIIDLKAAETAIELLVAHGDRAAERARALGRRAAEIGSADEIDHWVAVYLLLEKSRSMDARAPGHEPPMPDDLAAE